MAIKNKEKPKRSSLSEILSKEYKYENLILAILALVICAYSTMLLTGELIISSDTPVIGAKPRVFAWILMIIGLVSLFVVLVPFYKPAVPELKKMSWPSKNKFLGNVARVFIVMILLCICFVIYDYFLIMFFEAVC